MAISKTKQLQEKVEAQICTIINARKSFPLQLEHHLNMTISSYESQSPKNVAMESIKPMFIYWILESMDILKANGDIWETYKKQTIRYFEKTQCNSKQNRGGYGGGHLQIAHVAMTFVAVLSLVIVGTPEAYETIDRKAMYEFFLSVKQPNGSFAVHKGGESDVRAVYSVIITASLLGILTDELTAGVVDFISSCQTYEGGIAGEPEDEAHGGHTYCGFAVLCVLNGVHSIDLDKLTYWLLRRQSRNEGGFNGRTNKLVDGCYSLWVGAIFPMINQYIVEKGKVKVKRKEVHFDMKKMENFILGACQGEKGGFHDKPGMREDMHHTCACLSGLSIIAHNDEGSKGKIGGVPLKKVDPIYNVCEDKLRKARDYFSSKSM